MWVQVLIVAVGWLAGWWLLWRAPVLQPERRSPDDRRADCTVVIPVRNERHALPLLLADLRDQELRPRETIVVDDQSTDGSAAVARSFAGVTVLDGGEPAPGWAGKPWACARGAEVAGAGRLVFLDADVRLAPGGLGAVVEAQQRAGGLYSVLPYHDTRRPYEQASAMFNLVSFMGVGAGSPRRSGRADGAFGPCIVCDRDDYERVGGHGAARGAIADDLALARCFSRAGLPVTASAGGNLVSFRMYPSGLGGLVEGWSKNMATGARSVPLGRALLVAVWITAVLSVLFVGLRAVLAPTAPTIVVAIAGYVAFAVQQRLQLGQLGRFGWLTAALHPFLTLIFVVVLLRSLWLTGVRRRVRWKDREVAVGPRGRLHRSDGGPTCG
jgi:4,4'-diaponeurosporenoate glycosyltransferase